MAKYGDSDSGGSKYSSGGSKPSKPKKRKKRPSGISGFFENLVDDVQDTATHLIPGLVDTGSAIFHDLGKPLGLTHGQYRTDDIASAIKHSYTDPGTYWGEVGRSFADLFGGDVDGFLSHGRGARKALYDNPLGPMLDIATIVTGGAGAGVKAAKLAGHAPKPRSVRVEMSTGGGFDKTLSANPVIALRQRGLEAVSRAVPESTPMIGAAGRVGRHDRRLDARRTAHENAANLRPVREALAGIHGLKRKAVSILAANHNIDDLLKFYAVRHNALEAEIKRKRDTGRKSEPGDMIDVEAPREIGDGSAPGTSLVLRGERAKRVDMDEDLTYEEATPAGLLDADRRESLKRNQRNLAKVKTRLAELQQIKAKGYLDNPDPKLAKAADEVRALTDRTTARLIEEGLSPENAARRAALEAEVLRTAGIVGEVYGGAIRSHVNLKPDRLDVSSGRGRSKWKPGGKLDELQRNTGYNFWNARDDLNPAMFIHSARQVFEYRARLQRFETVLANAHWVSPDEVGVAERSGYKVVDAGSALRKDIDDVYKTLVDAEPVLAGTPGYDSMRRALEASLVRPDGSTDLVPMVPAKYWDELTGEFRRSSALVRVMVDTPTRFWRALTLNLRPAWIVNNFVGQMFLLAVAHGGRGIKSYVEQFGKKGKVADELAPELTDFGWAHESLADLAGLGGNRVTRQMRRMSDFMGNLNARLTDDHTRKAAWIATMKPHVAALQKARPDLSWDDAARELWRNERFADEVTQRVLDDMIDFSDLSEFERKVIKRAIPFYAWIKGISKRTGRLVADDPWKAVVGYQLGQQGERAIEEQYGAGTLPHFLEGIIPNPLGGEDGVAPTQGLNPFVTPADVVGMISGAFLPGRQQGPQNPLAQLGPVWKAPLEALANRDFFYGGEIDTDDSMSFAERWGRQTANSFAQTRLLQEYLQQRQAEREGLDYDPLFEPSFRNSVLSYLGIPTRTLDVEAARSRAKDERSK